MVKMLDSSASYYEPSRRSVNWLKLKKDYLAGLGDSLDLAVVGGYYGKGKRTNVYGAFLLACYDADAEEFQTICKIGTGFSEEALQEFYTMLKPLELPAVRGDMKVGGAKPDVWFEPKIVWEVLTADLSLSPVYAAAQGLVSGLFGWVRPRVLGVLIEVDKRRWKTGAFLCGSPGSFVCGMIRMRMMRRVQNR